MKRLSVNPFAALVFATLGSIATACAGQRDQAVHGGFERMLNHVPTTMAPAVPAQDPDPLLATVVWPLRDAMSAGSSAQVRVATLEPFDSLVAGYAHMLGHESAPSTAAMGQDLMDDPLYANLALPLRTWLHAEARRDWHPWIAQHPYR